MRTTFLSCIVGALLCTACSGGGAGPVPSQGASPSSGSASRAVAPVATATATPLAADFVTNHPAEADSFVESIGVDTHFNYTGTPYVDDYSTVAAELIASGIRHIRDGSVDYGDYGSRLQNLATAGINHSIEFDAGVTAGQIKTAIAAQSPYVDFVEPQNEYDADASSDSAWASQIVAEERLLYSTVRADPLNANIAVLGPALEDQEDYHDLGDLDSISDAGNLHNATCNLNPGTSTYIGISAMTALVRSSTSKSIWTTETGYGDDSSKACALSDAIIAKYDPRTVAERFIAGEPRTYFYQFADMPSDPTFGAMGMIDSSGSPKPQYYSVANMIGLLSDPGASFATTPFSYALTGSTNNVHHLLLQKRNGTYIMMLWVELPCWASVSANNIGGTPIAVLPQQVTLTTAQPFTSASLYQYSSGMNLVPTNLATSSTSFQLSISDSISFVVLK